MNVDLKGLKDEFAKKTSGDKISSTDSEKLKKIIRGIDKTLDSELQLRDAYILTEKRLGLSNLLENISVLFADNVYSNLPDVAKLDFAEAGKCIAFERPTAAAFHILRGTEGVLRLYYYSKIKKNRLQNPMWAGMVEQLKKRRNTTRTVMDSLDNIRHNFRNPTIHPQDVYVLDEAQDLFSVCIDAVNRMIKQLILEKLINISPDESHQPI